MKKHKKYPSVWKVTCTTGTTPMPLPVVVKALVEALAYFDNLKKKQQDQGSKNL